MQITFNELVQEIYSLDKSGKKQIKHLIEKQLIEERRESIRLAGTQAVENYQNGLTKHGTAKELLRDLND